MKFDPAGFARRFDRDTRDWHNGIPADYSGRVSPAFLAGKIHYFNFQLWHEEDKARMRDVSEKVIASVKRNIDRFNQSRNDSIEEFDSFSLRYLPHAKSRAGARQNSETLGSMVDRISVLTLKIYHMDLETKRLQAGEEHIGRSRTKLETLRTQRSDLVQCFNDLTQDMRQGRRFFKIYRQHKMYNDPSLNPMLYGGKK